MKMTLRCFVTTLVLTLAVVVAPVACAPPPTCSRISAAFYFDDNMYFVIGEELISVDEDNNIVDYMKTSELNFHDKITAAVGLYAYDEFYLLSGINEQGFVGFGDPSEYSITAYSDIGREFHGENDFHGIDAAVMGPWDEVLYFSGCSFISINPDDPTQIGEMRANSEIGLPCHVDAATYAPVFGQPIVIKGNEVWIFDPSTSKFDGPARMNDVLWALNRINFCPNEH